MQIPSRILVRTLLEELISAPRRAGHLLRKLDITAPDRRVTMRLATRLSLVLSWMSPAFAGAPPATLGSSIAHDSSGAAWPIATGADALFKIDGRTREIGRSRDGFTVDRVSVLDVANGVQLDVAMRLTDVRIAVTRHYVLFDDSPVLDLWTTVQSFDSRAQALSDVNGCSVAVPAGTPLAQRAAGGQRRRLARRRVYDAGPGAELPWSNDSLLRFRVVLVKRHAVHVHTQVSGHSITRETTRSSMGGFNSVLNGLQIDAAGLFPTGAPRFANSVRMAPHGRRST